MPELIVVFLLAMGLALLLTPLSRRLALRIGAIDHPGERRIHLIATPRLGGPAIFLALFGALLMASRVNASIDAMLVAQEPALGGLALGGLLIVMVGVMDDVRGVRPAIKLLVELAAATIAVQSGYRIEALHSAIVLVPLSMVLIVAVINAVNLVDGLDGLAVGLCLMISATLLALNLVQGEIRGSLGLAALCGGLAGFLPYNFHRARIFLGDSGALLLGYLVATATIATSRKMPAGAVAAWAAPGCLLALPLAELTLTIGRRWLRAMRVVARAADVPRYRFLWVERPALFRADRDHIHHRMLARSLSHRAAVLRLYLICGASCAMGLTMALYRDIGLAPLLTVAGLAAMAGVRWLGYREFALLRSGMWLPALQVVAFERSSVPRRVQMLVDLAAIIVGCGLAALIEGAGFSRALPVLAAVQLAAFMGSGLYRRTPDAGLGELLAMARALGWAVLAGLVAAMLAPSLGIGARMLILDGYLLASMTLGVRLAFRGLARLFESEGVALEELPAGQPQVSEDVAREPVPYEAPEAATARRGATVIPIRSAGVSN